MPSFTYDARDFAAFGRAMRRQSPLLTKRMRSRMGKLGRATATKMRKEMPHQTSKGGMGVRYSDSVESKGAAIVIGGEEVPLSYAHAFGVGQRGIIGRYKHPVGRRADGTIKWSGSPKTIMPISDYVWRNWAELEPALMAAQDAAVQETLDGIVFGELE